MRGDMRGGVLLDSVEECHNRAWSLGVLAQKTPTKPSKEYSDKQRLANISLLVLKLPELNAENAKRAWRSIQNIFEQIVCDKIKGRLACELAGVAKL